MNIHVTIPGEEAARAIDQLMRLEYWLQDLTLHHRRVTAAIQPDLANHTTALTAVIDKLQHYVIHPPGGAID